MTMLKFSSQGIIAPSSAILRPAFEVQLVDVTPNSIGFNKPVLTVIDALQAPDSTELRFQMKLPSALPRGSGSMDWLEFGALPIEALIFPESGQRQIQVRMSVFDLPSRRLAAAARCVWSVDAPYGYLEVEQEEGRAQAAALHLAMCLAASDGSIDPPEVKVIKEWAQKNVKSLDRAVQSQRQRLLNEALEEAKEQLRSNEAEELLDDAIWALNEIDEPRYKYDAYELCLHVLKADGEAHPEEMASVTKIAKRLDLDEAKVRLLTDRHTKDVRFAVIEGTADEEDRILGIDEDMEPDEIRRHLNKLFKKHSARSTHDNPKVADQAKEWLDRIGEARARHLSR